MYCWVEESHPESSLINKLEEDETTGVSSKARLPLYYFFLK